MIEMRIVCCYFPEELGQPPSFFLSSSVCCCSSSLCLSNSCIFNCSWCTSCLSLISASSLTLVCSTSSLCLVRELMLRSIFLKPRPHSLLPGLISSRSNSLRHFSSP